MFPKLWDELMKETTVICKELGKNIKYPACISYNAKVTFCDHCINTLTFMYLYGDLFMKLTLYLDTENLKAK